MLCAALATQAQKTITIKVTNPINKERTDIPVVINLASYGEVCSASVKANNQEIPYQLDDLNNDHTFDELCFLVDLKGKETRDYEVILLNEGKPHTYPPRVYAEMVVRNEKVKQKNKHDNYINAITANGNVNSYNMLHHHGVAFESELNGIRIYFDKRQTLDLYGKRYKRLEIKDTQFYTQPDQKTAGYGDDVLWVGNSFGLGALRGWNGQEPTMIEPVKTRSQRILANGPLRTIIEINDYDWTLPVSKKDAEITIRYTQYAGHRDTDVDVSIINTSDHTTDIEPFSTGIINIKGSVEYSDHHGLRGCWGTDYPASDTINWKRETVGLGIFIPKDYLDSEIPANKDNYTFVIKSKCNKLSYKIAYTSDNEDFGLHIAKDWFAWLKTWRREIENPIKIAIQ